MTPNKETTHNKAKEDHKKIRREAFKKLGLILVGLLLFVNTVQLARFGEIAERVDLYNKGVIDEIGKMRQDTMLFGQDLNEIRKFLLLPTKDYSFFKDDQGTQDTEETGEDMTTSAIYSFLSQVTDEQSYKKNSALAVERIKTLSKDQSFIGALAQIQLKAGQTEDNEVSATLKITDETGNALFAFSVDKKTAALKIQSSIGTYVLTATDPAAQQKEITDYFKNNKEQVAKMKDLIGKQKTAIVELMKNKDITAIFGEKKISMTPAPEESDEAITYYIINSESNHLLGITIQRKDGTLSFNDKTYNDTGALLPDLLNKLKEVDASSELQKMVNERRQELEKIFQEDAFKEMLKTDGLTIESNPREEYNKLLYDVKNSDKKVVFSFAIELSSGIFKVIKDDTEIDLYSLEAGSKKKP
jgi:hypothetical protein